jgi:hypothetical protein
MSSTSTWAVSVERTRPEDALAIRSVLGAFSSLIPSETVDRLATENGGTVPSLSLEQANQVMLKLHEAGVHSSKHLEERIEIRGDRSPSPHQDVGRTIAIISGVAVAAALVLLFTLAIAPSSLEHETETAVIALTGLCPGESREALRAAISSGHRTFAAAGFPENRPEFANIVWKLVATTRIRPGECGRVIEGYAQFAARLKRR